MLVDISTKNQWVIQTMTLTENNISVNCKIFKTVLFKFFKHKNLSTDSLSSGYNYIL